MNIRHKDLLIDKDQPFKECKLGREKYATILSQIVSDYKDGFVMAINSEWGTGKTTFIKMWQQHLINKEFETLYFNAWEDDFSENPIVGIMAAFKSLTGEKSNSLLKSLLSLGSKIIKNVAPQVVKFVAEANGVTKVIADLVENSVKGTTEILEEEIKKYNERKKGINEFRKSLEEYISSLESEKPLVFIIDELDRCRPSYAIALLESIKHLFSVPGVVFVLSIDKEQLGHAMRGVYGSEQLNANEYLRRFIDIEYNMPEPNAPEFVSYLYNYFGFDEKIMQHGRPNNNDFRDESISIQKFSLLLFENGNITLRQQEKIMAHARIALSSLNSNQYLLPGLFIYLVFLKNHDSKTYTKIKNKELTTQGLLDSMKDTIPKGIKKNDILNVIYLEALLATTYHNYKYERDISEKLITEENHRLVSIKVKSNFDFAKDQEEFIRLMWSVGNKDFAHMSIKHLIDKIDLLQQVSL